MPPVRISVTLPGSDYPWLQAAAMLAGWRGKWRVNQLVAHLAHVEAMRRRLVTLNHHEQKARQPQQRPPAHVSRSPRGRRR